MGKGRTLIRGTLMLAASGLALRGFGILFQMYLSRRIGPAGMGLLQLVLTVGGFAGTLGSSGVRVAALQLTAKACGTGDSRQLSAALHGCLRYGLICSAAVGLGLILLARPIALGLLREAQTVPALRVMGLVLPFVCLTGVMRSCFTACGRVRELVGVELLERILSVGLTVGLLRLAEGGLDRVCAAVVAGSFGAAGCSFGLLYFRFRKTVRERGRALGRPVVSLCVPLALNDYLRSGLGAVEQFLIPYGLEQNGSRVEALAAYGRISAMVFPVLWFPSELILALCELMVSELAKCQARGDTDRLRELVGKSLRYAVFFAGIVAAGLWFGGPKLGLLLFDSEQAGYDLRLFAPMVLFLYLDAMVDGLQKGLGQQLYLVRYNSFTNVIDVVGLYTLLPRFGIAGYLFTYIFSHLVNFFLSLRRLLIVTGEAPKTALTHRALPLQPAAGHSAQVPVPGNQQCVIRNRQR